MNFDEQLQVGASHHRSGRLAEAEKIYRQILVEQPNHPDALHLLGLLALHAGRTDAAIDLIKRAIGVCPTRPYYYGNLGNALRAAGQTAAATQAYREAIRLKPDFVEALANLASILTDLKRPEEAIDACRRALRFKPDYADAHVNLGNALMDQLRVAEAIESYRRGVHLKPDFAGAHNNLGIALQENGQFADAIASFSEAARLKPDYAEACLNLGNAFRDIERFDDAIDSYRKAIRIKPNLVVAHNNLGSALKRIGNLDEAIEQFRRAIEIKPNYVSAHSNLLYAIQCHPDYDLGMIQAEHERWNQRHATPLARFIKPHTNTCDPRRRLRIGYVSPDFRQHVVGQNLLPLLREHDHEQVQVFCYANLARDDLMSELIRQFVDEWRVIAGLSDEDAGDLIRADGIDILVDLASHTAGNRLLVFAAKPAPVQATYLGYCSTTGLETMDYRFSDPYLDPPGTDLSVYSEMTIRLPQTYWCYACGGPAPEPSARTSGDITLGCLNNFAKVGPALELWAEILRALPEAKMILHCPPGAQRAAVEQRLSGKGISARRIEFVGRQNWADYIRTYNRIDIALDPFPWGGGITTCDALWMGVPVVTLAGKTAVGRGGVSILANIGLTELIAETAQQYVQIVSALSADLGRLADLRASLRGRMKQSPLTDAPQFARNVEAAYREMWVTWCKKESH